MGWHIELLEDTVKVKNGEMKNLIGKVIWVEDGEDSDPK